MAHRLRGFLQSTSRKDENIEHLKIHQVIGNQAWVPEGQTAHRVLMGSIPPWSEHGV